MRVPPGVTAVIGNGLVVNPEALLNEIKSLTDRGVKIDSSNLLLSDRAHVIFPWHTEEERLYERGRTNGESIGTTMRGIGPCYRDKVGRTHAIRLGDFYRDSFHERVERIVADKNQVLASLARGEDGRQPGAEGRREPREGRFALLARQGPDRRAGRHVAGAARSRRTADP